MFMLFHALGINGPAGIVLGLAAMVAVRFALRGRRRARRMGRMGRGGRGW
jgi:hypothetical protein